jgi:putative DNA primase/helicase
VESLKRQREAEEIGRNAKAREEACLIWALALHCYKHPYLTVKGINANWTRLYGDELVIPVRIDGLIHSMQFIGIDGAKRFLPGGRIKDGYFSIGNIAAARVVCIVEGFATGASIFEATGYPVAVAFTAVNLMRVAKVICTKYPHLTPIICADDDFATPSNPGLTAAKAAADAVGGLVAVPVFGQNRPTWATDFNDMALLYQGEAVKQAIMNARTL